MTCIANKKMGIKKVTVVCLQMVISINVNLDKTIIYQEELPAFVHLE